MNYDEAKQYFNKIAKESGLPEDQTAAVLQAMENEKFAREVANGFVRHDEYSRGLDTVRNREQELDKWYNEVAVPAYKTNLGGIERLRQYETTFGDLDVATPTSGAHGNNRNFDPTELEKRYEERLRSRDQAYTNLAKSLSRMNMDYYKRFGEVLNTDEVEKISLQRGLPPDLAYEEYIKPRVVEVQQRELDTKLKAAREEGFKDAMSKGRIPVDTTPREASPFFERTEVPKTAPSDLEADRSSRNAFTEGWNTYAEELAQRHRTP